MTNKEWLITKKESCETGIEFYHSRIKELERELEMIKSLIDLAEGQSVSNGTAQ